MNDRQNTVVATVVVSLVLAIVFLCPWRVEPSQEIRWSPIYQPPLSYVRTYDPEYGRKGGSRIGSNDAQVALDLLALEILLIGAAGGALYVYTADSDREDDSTAPPQG